jgi:hypothetical protein
MATIQQNKDKQEKITSKKSQNADHYKYNLPNSFWTSWIAIHDETYISHLKVVLRVLETTGRNKV